ncbi:MAG: hypothetical protein GY754_41360 [bacterium]|nr:hypothetical protein [bacterium]
MSTQFLTCFSRVSIDYLVSEDDDYSDVKIEDKSLLKILLKILSGL